MSTTSATQVDPTDIAGPQQTGHRHINRWLVLAIVCFGQFMVVLDATVVNVALPAIQSDLKFSDANLQWVINSYALVFGGFLLLGGRAADLLGRKRLFIAGVALFTVASAINGFATSSGMLVAGRALQGLGGALVSPAALSTLTTSFPEPGERAKALGVWSAIAAGGSAFGLLLGGVLTESLSWGWIFFVNIPVGILAVFAALRFVPESRGQLRHRHFDIAGAVTVTGGLMLLVFSIVKAQAWGWGSGKTLGFGGLAVALLVAFIAIELRSRSPLMRLGIFKLRPLAVANASMLLVASGMFATFFFVSLFIQDILHYSALKAGLAFLPFSAGIIVGAGAAQALVRKIGPRTVSAIGLVLAIGGMLILTQLSSDGAYASNLLTAFMPLSIGMGMTFVPITLLATSGVTAADAGLASGLLNTMQQIGGALGLAILATVSTTHATNKLEGLGRVPTDLDQLNAGVSGSHYAFMGGAIAMLAAAVLMLTLLRKRHIAAAEAGSGAPVHAGV